MKSTNQDLFNQLNEFLSTLPELNHLKLNQIARPSIRLTTQRIAQEQLDLGESRIGGIPDVFPGFEWPRWKPEKIGSDKYGSHWNPAKPVPLGFIAQIDLSSIPKINDDLPSVGWLYFFYDRYSERWGFDPEDRGCCRILYANCDRSALRQTKPPTDADPEHTGYACRIEGLPELTLPDDFSEVEYQTPAYEAYYKLKQELFDYSNLTHHRFMGYPQLVQNPMERECQLASNGVYCGGASRFEDEEKIKALELGVSDWQLLLQVDTDDYGTGWMWGDCGRIYFWIKKQDLRSHRFEDAWLIFQCS